MILRDAEWVHADDHTRIQPVGSQITSGTSIAGHTWNLWRGPNQNWQVLSFVSSTGDLKNFNVDLNEFFSMNLTIRISGKLRLIIPLEYIVAQQGVASTQVSSISCHRIFVDIVS